VAENRCRFCLGEYPVPSMTRFCEERHLKAIQSIQSIQGALWMGLRELKNFIGGELTVRIEKAVLGTLRDTRHEIEKDRESFLGYVGGRLLAGEFIDFNTRGRVWWENPNLQDIPVLISLGISPALLEQIERIERKCECYYTSKGMRKPRPRLRLRGLSRDPERVIAKLR